MINVKYKDILTLDDNHEYVVSGVAQYNDNNYLYLVDINNNSNIKFAEFNNNLIIELNKDKDSKLINILLPLFLQSTKNDVIIEYQ